MDKKEPLFKHIIDNTKSFIKDLLFQGYKGYHTYLSFISAIILFLFRYFMEALKGISYAWILFPLIIWILLAYAHCRNMYYKLNNLIIENIDIEKLEKLYKKGKKLLERYEKQPQIIINDFETDSKKWVEAVNLKLPKTCKFEFIEPYNHHENEYFGLMNRNSSVITLHRCRLNKLHEIICNLRKKL
jgi:hypothetical protein